MKINQRNTVKIGDVAIMEKYSDGSQIECPVIYAHSRFFIVKLPCYSITINTAPDGMVLSSSDDTHKFLGIKGRSLKKCLK